MRVFRYLCLVLLLYFLFRPTENKAGRNVAYGEVNGQKLLLDVYLPETTNAVARPAVILIHGGGWAAGDKKMFKDAAVGLAKGGYVAFSINYRLAKKGQNLWPAQLDDCQRAVRWVRAHAEKYGIDPEKIGVIGHSAGGHLAACLGTRETRDNSDEALAKHSSRVTCLVNMSGPVDLVIRETRDGDGAVRNLLGGSEKEKPEAARDASPLYFVDGETAPTLLIHGKLDRLVPVQQAERFAEALRKAEVETDLIAFEDEEHIIKKPKNADRMIEGILMFLKKHLPIQ